MKILLHSSKTMKAEVSGIHKLTTPEFIEQAHYLNGVLKNIDQANLANVMGISQTLAEKVEQQIDEWGSSSKGTATALTFRGDIYSGLSAAQWSKNDAIFAQNSLLILSGLYGILRPFDAIKPYRLEMGYRLKLADDLILSKFWEKELANKLDVDDSYINLTSKEYFNVIEHQLSKSMVISPKFLTLSDRTHRPIFVTVHAKIARGSFANWLIKNKIDNPKEIVGFNFLNYKYDESLSSKTEPVFVCERFEGLGMSVRLK